VLTAAAGYAIAPGAWDPYVFTSTVVGTTFCSSAANSFNQVCGLNHVIFIYLKRRNYLRKKLLRN